MTWIVVIALALLTFAVLVWGLKLPRGAREMVGAALFLGLAGYALQGSPAQPGAPTVPRETRATGEAALIDARREMGQQFGSGDRWLITADALSRRGQHAAAAGFLRGAIREQPDNPDLWVALGNALVGHSNGAINPAALYAFQRAADIAPDHPGPPFFTGLALAQTGRFMEAREIWDRLLDQPGDPAEPWRADLEARLQRLDAIIAMQSGTMLGGAAQAAPDPADGAEGAGQ